MKGFSFIQWIVIIILALLTALEPLSIDLYLPGFLLITEALNTTDSYVQISLSMFLGGFAIGQLLWGPLADKFGRKKPILVALLIFIVASVACMYVKTVEQLWIARFIQAIGGCAGVVIARAIVTDYFEKNQTLKIFALLALIMGIAPIIAPSIGNGVLAFFGWKGLFGAMAALGMLSLLVTLFVLPETHKKTGEKMPNVVKTYIDILKNKRFTVYSAIAGIVNGVLMVYVANGPFLIMEKGGFSGSAFGIIFAINALGLMIASFATSLLQKYIPTNKLVKYAVLVMATLSVLLLGLMYMNISVVVILFILFFFIFPIGILFPTTTELALSPFADGNKSGSASALFGSIQLAVAFICSVASSYISDGSLTALGLSFFLCCTLAFVIVFSRINLKDNYVVSKSSDNG